jgi:hypothetical protein
MANLLANSLDAELLPKQRERLINRFTRISFVFCLLPAVVALLLALDHAAQLSRIQLIEGILLNAIFPVVAAVVPVIFPARAVRIIAATLLCGFTIILVLYGCLWGLIYSPASFLMAIACTF